MNFREHSFGEAPQPESILDFDIETLAAGYADPSWVPDKVTAVAWSWVGDDEVHSRVRPDGYFDRDVRRRMLLPLLVAMSKADIVQGHNIVRFDLRVLNAECMRLGLEPLKKLRVLDTIQILRSKGFKKGQDDLSTLLGVPIPKKTMNWQNWDDAYEAGAPWTEVKERVESDVLAHKLLTVRMQEKGWLRGPRDWKP